MELNLIWCLYLSKHKLGPISTGTCTRTYFKQFVVGFKKFQNYVLFYQEPEPAPGRKFPEPEPPQNRPAPKLWFLLIISAVEWSTAVPLAGVLAPFCACADLNKNGPTYCPSCSPLLFTESRVSVTNSFPTAAIVYTIHTVPLYCIFFFDSISCLKIQYAIVLLSSKYGGTL